MLSMLGDCDHGFCKLGYVSSHDWVTCASRDEPLEIWVTAMMHWEIWMRPSSVMSSILLLV